MFSGSGWIGDRVGRGIGGCGASVAVRRCAVMSFPGVAFSWSGSNGILVIAFWIACDLENRIGHGHSQRQSKMELKICEKREYSDLRQLCRNDVSYNYDVHARGIIFCVQRTYSKWWRFRFLLFLSNDYHTFLSTSE
ncbi:hypothetical protein M758_12G139700 [Ceratodon purpureus]|nr:hypothetical protein M758_12G139700 [Ceratodon purpureus]